MCQACVPSAPTPLPSELSIKVWINGVSEINTTDSTFAAGSVSLVGGAAIFTNFKVGYDNNGDNDSDDPGDDVVIDEDFTGTQFTVSHDHAGNLINDGTLQYIYDALETRIEY